MRETCHFANINTSVPRFPYSAVCDHVLRGALLIEDVLNVGAAFDTDAERDHDQSQGEQGEPAQQRGVIRNRQNVCEFAWFLFFRAVQKGLPFVSGAWLIEDPQYALFDELSPHCYTRKLVGSAWNKALETAYSKATFGSTHLVEFVMHSAKRGAWSMPEDRVVQRLEEGGKGLGYYQMGIDIAADEAHNDGSVTMGLFCDKMHLVIGKVPPKHGDKRTWLYVKAEHYGTKLAIDTVQHTAQLGLTVTGTKKYTTYGDAKRREKPEKQFIKAFVALIELVFTFTLPLLDTELTEDEIAERAKYHGLSYMIALARQIRASTAVYLQCSEAATQAHAGVHTPAAADAAASVATSAASVTNDRRSLAMLHSHCCAFIDVVEQRRDLDHLTVRFGSEVIFDLRELGVDDDDKMYT